MRLDDAVAVKVGSTDVAAVYAGATQIWPVAPSGGTPFRQNSFNGNTPGVVVTGDHAASSGDSMNTTVDANSSLVFTSTAYDDIAVECRNTVAAGTQSYIEFRSFPLVTTMWGRAYFRFDTAGGFTSNCDILRALDTGNAICLRVLIDSSKRLRLRDNVGTDLGISAALPMDQWVRLEWYVQSESTPGAADGVVTLRIYTDPASTTPTEELTNTTATTKSSVEDMRFGIVSGNSSNATLLYVDEVALSSEDWLGPI